MKRDPDDILREEGPDALRAIIDGTKPFVDDEPPPQDDPRFANDPLPDEPPPVTLPFIDMSRWDDEAPPPPEWAVHDRIPLRQTTLFSGEGAVGKSITQLHLSVAHVLGKDWLGTMPGKGPAIFVDAEDEQRELHRRLADICKHYGAAIGDAVKAGLHLVSLHGRDAVLAAAGRSGRITPTPLYTALIEAAGDIKPKMVGIASSADVFAGSEIDRAQVQQFVGLLTRIAIAANGAVVLIGHPSLDGIRSDSGLSGSTQWHNSVRARFYMKGIKPKDGDQPDNDLREIVFMKNNYGPRAESIALRYQNGLFIPIAGATSLDNLAREATAENVFLDLLNRFTRQNRNVSDHYGTNYAPSSFSKEDEAKAAALTSKDIEGAMRRLFKAEKITIETYRRSGKACHRLATT